jgi:hypothetical protein
MPEKATEGVASVRRFWFLSDGTRAASQKQAAFDRRAAQIRGLRRIYPTMKVQKLAMACGLLLSLSACGGGTPPSESAAEAAVRAAEVGGAADNPKAALHLKYARDQVDSAKKLIDEEEYDKAAALLARAEADAELALALSRVENARAEAQAALNDVEELKRKQTEAQEQLAE